MEKNNFENTRRIIAVILFFLTLAVIIFVYFLIKNNPDAIILKGDNWNFMEKYGIWIALLFIGAFGPMVAFAKRKNQFYSPPWNLESLKFFALFFIMALIAAGLLWLMSTYLNFK